MYVPGSSSKKENSFSSLKESLSFAHLWPWKLSSPPPKKKKCPSTPRSSLSISFSRFPITFSSKSPLALLFTCQQAWLAQPLPGSLTAQPGSNTWLIKRPPLGKKCDLQQIKKMSPIWGSTVVLLEDGFLLEVFFSATLL